MIPDTSHKVASPLSGEKLPATHQNKNPLVHNTPFHPDLNLHFAASILETKKCRDVGKKNIELQ